MTLISWLRNFVSVAIIMLVAACVSNPPGGATKMTTAQVQSIFINRYWNGPEGRFYFDGNGTYSYRDTASGRTGGPWAYSFVDDGVIQGNTTRYTFFRSEDGTYYYLHSRSGKYYPARLS